MVIGVILSPYFYNVITDELLLKLEGLLEHCYMSLLCYSYITFADDAIMLLLASSLCAQHMMWNCCSCLLSMTLYCLNSPSRIVLDLKK